MARITLPLLTAISGLIPLVAGHAAFFHPSMWGFNVTMQTFPYDNRPVSPLQEYTFDQWWFHGHLDYPPNEGDIFELPAGQPVTTQVACDKGATTFFASDPGGNIQDGDNPCPGSPIAAIHTTGFDDLKGCALAITYKSNVSDVQPEDFTVFSVNQTCVWNRFTDFQVPERMPACPPGGCICAWFWIHSPDSGGEQNYMNGFRCNVTGATSDVPLAKPQLPRRCGADPDDNRPEGNFGNCTWGAKQPFYWLQKERNNMFEGYYSPPFYTNLYNFLNGAQEDIFEDSYPGGLPAPTVNGTVPVANFAGVQPTATPSAPSGLPMAVVGTPAPVSSASAGAGGSGGGGEGGGGGTMTATSGTSSSSSSSSLAASGGTSAASSMSAASTTAPASSGATPASVSASAASDAAASVSVSVSTATVVSTQLVTVTAADPASSASTIVLSPPNTSAVPSASSVSASSASASSSVLPSSSATPATSTLLLNTPVPSLHADVNLASPTSSSSSSSGTTSGLGTCVKSGDQAVLGKRRLARRSTESGFQEFWEALRPRAFNRAAYDSGSALEKRADESGGEGEEYKPARRSRLWRVF